MLKRKRTSLSYKKDILEKYEIAKEGELSVYLYRPIPSSIRSACVYLFNKGLSPNDKIKFKQFFEITKEDIEAKDIKEFKVTKFKPIVHFLKKKNQNLKSSIALELISILVDFRPRPYDKYLSEQDDISISNELKNNFHYLSNENKETNYSFNNNEKIPSLNKTNLKFILIALPSLALLMIFFLKSTNLSPTSNPIITEKALSKPNKILASKLFSKIRTFKSQTPNETITLSGFNFYSWEKQQKSLIPLDSILVKLTLRNNSNQQFYVDRLVLQTIENNKITKQPTVESDLFFNANLNVVINQEVPQNYVYKIIKDEQFSYLPAKSEVDMIIKVKGNINHTNELVSFSFFVEGHNSTNRKHIELKKTYSIGFFTKKQ